MWVMESVVVMVVMPRRRSRLYVTVLLMAMLPFGLKLKRCVPYAVFR